MWNLFQDLFLTFAYDSTSNSNSFYVILHTLPSSMYAAHVDII